MRPPIVAADYRVQPGQAVTLINISANKGAALFWQLVSHFPDREFIAVRGSYGNQIVPPKGDRPRNVTVLDNTPNIQEVYARTRVLLMPSARETFGRVALEAAASGIPTLANPTVGLREALGRAGIFACAIGSRNGYWRCAHWMTPRSMPNTPPRHYSGWRNMAARWIVNY